MNLHELNFSALVRRFVLCTDPWFFFLGRGMVREAWCVIPVFSRLGRGMVREAGERSEAGTDKRRRDRGNMIEMKQPF